jgi:hypothetical protein
MLKEKKKRNLKTFSNPFSKGVLSMKPFKITAVLLALLVLPLFAGQVFAAVTYGNLDSLSVPFGKISKNTDNRALLGIRINTDESGKILQSLTVKSFNQKAFSIDRLKLYKETNDTVGLQVPGDSLVKVLNTYTYKFDSNDSLKFTSINLGLDQQPDSNLLYIAIDAHTDTVGTYPDRYDGQCLEVIIMPGRLLLNGPASNPDTIYNRRYSSNPLDDSTGFCPDSPTNHGYPDCRYRLCFDTHGPLFNLHLCVGDSTCKANQTISQGDTVQICATGISEPIDGCIHVFGRVLTDWDHIVTSREMFLQDSIVLCENDEEGRPCDKCSYNWNTVFVIPDFANGVNGPPGNRLPYSGDYRGIDADTGQWFVCAWAKDSSGNVDTICIGHDDLLPWKIDTRKPNIDSVSFFLWWDANHDGKVALGDTVAIFGWAVSNPWVPQLEVDSMIADMSRFGKGRVWLNDIDNNNKVFRAFVCLDVPVPGLDTADCDLNSIKVWAWDNACNYDTERVGICDTVDLDPPTVSVEYKYYLDYDTSHSCVGIGDTVRITVTTGGTDIATVTADMKDAGIDSLIRTEFPIPYKGTDTYETIWEVTKPPIEDGKDKDNTTPPANDNDYTVWVTVCDDAHNCVKAQSNALNRTLDTRRPRPIGYFCQDTVPCALHAHSLAHGVIELDWSKTCQEKDSWYFYVYYSTDGINWDSIGSTYENETPDPNFNHWYSEPLPVGYYYFKVQTEDSCDNLGPFSCEVAAFADSTPPKACIVFPDSGGIYGNPFTVKARTEDQDICSASLWYRLRPDLNDPPTGPIGPWTPCLSVPYMYRPDSGLVFLDTVACIHDYVGMVELMPLACDVHGNCQDTIRAYQDACIDDSLQNLRPGHFLFDWDTTRACAHLVSVNDTISPQTSCGFNVRSDIMNQVIVDVDGAKPTDLFTIDVKALNKYGSRYRIDYRNHVTMPCTVMVSVDNWDFGTQHLYVSITTEANGKECIPCPMIIDLCVPWQTAPCITIVAPLEWQRIPCSKTDKTCVPIWAKITPGCPESLVTQVKFFYSKNTPGPPWNLIEEVVEPDTQWVLGHPNLYWKTCWNNYGLVQDGDTVYFMAEGFNQYHMGSTSKMVKVFVDCKAPTVKLKIEDVITTCFGIPKVAGDIILKAEILDTLVDVTDVDFWYKLHSDPDIPAFWHKLTEGQSGWWWGSGEEIEPWSENIWAGDYDTEDLPNQTWIDIRVSVRDQAGNTWLDSDEDGQFDDSTFDAAVAADAGITVFVDNQAPAPAITMVADTAAKIYNVNPSTLLGGLGEAYVKAGDDIHSEISVLPSEDTCEVMKVEWFLCTPELLRAPEQSPAQGGKFIPHVPNQGDNCENPIELTLPRDLDFEDTNHTCGRYNDYQGTCLAPFDSSEDIIYKLNVTMNVILKIKWRTLKMWKSGMALFEECPRHGGPVLSGSDLVGGGYGGRCLYHSTGISPHEWHHLKDSQNHRCLFLEPGTYYLMLDSKHGCRQADLASGQSPSDMDDGNFELEITGEAIGCQYVGISNDPYHFPVNFNPVKDGLIQAYELEDHWWHGNIQAVLYDSLGNYKTDDVGLYILDVTPSQAVIVNPLNDSYVSGDVLLQSKSLNDYEICKVCYEYKAEGDSVWHPVNDGYPNACVTGHGPNWYLTWHTLNTIPDGAYYLRAVATDCSNNVDTMPPTIKVTVSNGVPVVTMDDPRICSRTCPDDTVDTLGYVSGTVSLYATVTSSIPVDHVVFMYKDIFEYPGDWTPIDSDYFPTDGKYSVGWNTKKDTLEGRYHLKAIAYTSSGKYGESKPIVVSVDNSGPFAQIISIMGEDHLDYGVDISKGTVVPIEIVAIDSTSNDGWTRCYNSGLTSISVCIAMCDSNYKPKDTTEITKCFEVDSVYDGIHTVLWNTSGLEYEGCEGCYYIYVKAYDCLGNLTVSDSVKVWVRDITAPVTTIGGFDGNYVYGYSSEKVKTLLFEYADSGTTNWIPIGWSDTLRICSFQNSPSCNSCPYYLYKTSWNPASLKDGIYQIRVISHDSCSNQADSLAPVAYFMVEGGTITPYNPEVLGALSFMKNWCVGGMHGLVHETSSQGTPVMIARYGSSYTYECVEMQANLNSPHEYDGSFFGGDIEYGGPAKFFSSVTVKTGDEHMTGEPAYVTYLAQGSFDVVQVKRDLGTHGTYQQGCVDITIPAGAVGNTFTYDRYLWVSPTIMPWVPLTQPDLKPIGDNDGHATYVAFTDCYYCCGWWSSHYGEKQSNILKSSSDGGDCCFNPGQTHYAKIKMCYDSTVTTDKEHLAVMWWDCESGTFKSDGIYLDFQGVEGFNTTNHTVEFATSCLSGPFAVVEKLERPCAGSIVVSLREQYPDITPYSNGYTSPMPKFTGFITDNVQGTGAITQSSITFKIDNQRIYDGSQSYCNVWAKGFGNLKFSGYDLVSGLFIAGWSTRDYDAPCTDDDHFYPAPGLAAGNHMATLTAQNKNIQTCTDTVQFKVDATPPEVRFVEGCVGGPTPEFDVYIIDRESGVNKKLIYVDFGSFTLTSDQLASMWVNDSLLHVTLPVQKLTSGGEYEVRVYDGSYGSSYGPVDMVGNRATRFWYRYRVDLDKPVINLVKSSYRFRRPVLFNVYDYAGGCGIYEIMISECTNSPTGYTCTPAPADSVVYDYQTQILRYYPPASGAWIQATVKDSAHNTTFLDSVFCVEDYDPPMVSFVPGYNGKYVGSNPTIKFVVTDGVAGVNWETVNARISGCNNFCDFPWTEVLNHMQNDTVTLSCPLACSDGSSFTIYVYSDYYYNKGPADKGDNYIKNAQAWQYTVDASGPSVTLKTPSDSLCSRPLLFEIKDAYSGFDTVYVYEDSSLVAPNTVLTRDPHIPNYWRYTPTAGKTRLDIKAVDKLGNETWYGWKIKSDCTPPLVTFNAEFVTCDSPTVNILLHDDQSGVDWTKVYVDLYKYSDRIQTFTPDLLTHKGDTLTVKGDGAWLGLTDGSNLYVNVYSSKNPSWKGPVDSAGNYQTSTSLFSKTYIADCSGPSITWTWPAGAPVDSCSTPLTFKISDAYSGVKTVGITEDGSVVPSSAYSYDRSSQMLTYSPSAGKHKVVITATDNLGNVGTYTFNRKDDCLPPAVEFVKGYVAKNPTVKFVVRDDKIGVDWNTVNVDLYQNVYAPYERCTFTAADIALNNLKHGDTVMVTCTMDLDDGRALTAYVYSEKYGLGSYGKGPSDLSGNFMPKWQECTYIVDAKGPVLKLLTPTYAVPIRVQVQDTASGVNPTSFAIKENGVGLTYNYDASTNVLTFTPTTGMQTTVTITVADNLGNLGSLSYRNWDDDAVGPVLDTNLVKQTLMAPPIKIKFTDSKSGVDWSTLVFKVDGQVVSEESNESLTVEEDQGLIEYWPKPGRKQIVVSVNDNAGNMSMVWPFWSEAGELYFINGKDGVYNYPNPFDPREKSTYIVLGLSKSVLATIKIYDFAGEYVRTLGPPDQVVKPNQEIPWDGKTDDGTEVANGTYLCYIKARDLDASKTVTAVIKITVLKKDK